LISSIALIGLYLFAFAVLGLYLGLYSFFNQPFESSVFALVSILGIVGYIGIVLLFFYHNKKYLKTTFYFLCCGLLSFLLIFFISGYSLKELYYLLTDKYEYPENAIFIWFISVSLFYTVKVGWKIFR